MNDKLVKNLRIAIEAITELAAELDTGGEIIIRTASGEEKKVHLEPLGMRELLKGLREHGEKAQAQSNLGTDIQPGQGAS